MEKIICWIIIWFYALIYYVASRNMGSSSDAKNKGPYKVYRLHPNSTDQLDTLKDMWKSASRYQVNFWKDPSNIGSAVDLMAPAHMQTKLEDFFRIHDITFMVIIEDVKKLIMERERTTNFDKTKLLFDDASPSQRVSFDFSRYHDYEEMRSYMRTVERQYPNIARVYNLGFSHENRPIEMIKIGFPLYSTSKKGIWVDAGIHAREWASHSTAIYFIHQLVTKYEQDPVVTKLVQNLTWYITPVVNPDGYEFTRSSVEPEIRMWRKNRSPNPENCRQTTDKCCKGVDLNRNFDFHWGESGASANPCDEVYQGSTAFSEPESRAIRDFLWAHQNEIEAVITMHTYSQLWIHPFGHERGVYPPDVDDLKDTANSATVALEKLYGTRYKVGSGADALYPAAGGSDDWSKSKAGIKFVYLLELRPEENVFDGFILDTKQLIPTGRETWAGIKVVANAVLGRNHLDTVSVDQNNGGNVVQSPQDSQSTSTTVSTSLETSTSSTTTTPSTTTSTISPTTTASTTTTIATTTTTPSTTASTTESTSTSVATTSTTTTTTTTTTIAPATTTTSTTTTTPTTTTTTPAATTTTESTSSSSSTPSFTTSTSTQPSTTTSSSTTSTDTTTSTTVAILLQVPAGEDPHCFDKATEKRCSRWVWHRQGICQRIVEYMSQNCAKTCGFCGV